MNCFTTRFTTRFTTLCLASLLFLATTSANAEVDQRPLEVAIVEAFPQLEWPEYLTGKESGKSIDVRPVIVTGAGDGSNRLFIATQYGTIHVLENSSETVSAPLFLDLRDRVDGKDRENEEGFLGMAFHPRYTENGEFFVYYTASRDQQPDRKSIISRFRVSKSSPDRGNLKSEAILLQVSQPYWNHNGGTVVFGPDGYLYIVLGDGGYTNDPHMHGQNLRTLLGSILRIDIEQAGKDRPYTIPPDNPFVGKGADIRKEIWAYGLRNVWRLSFDRKTGTAWAADVGQNLWEEINIIHRGGNYGWNLREGRHPFEPVGSDVSPNYIEPIWEYGREDGKSIIGGHVYRGKSVPALAGAYLYADYVSGRIWALWYDAKSRQVLANRLLRKSGQPVTTFGEDDQGELYFATQNGRIFKFAAGSSKKY